MVNGVILKASKLGLSSGGKSLFDLNFTVKGGQVLGLSGPSGSGKTTCLRTLAGQEVGNSGAIYLDDHDVSTRSPSQRGMTLLNQNNALFAHLSVEKNVSMALRDIELTSRELNDRVAEVLGRLNLSEVAALKPHQLSAAQQQCAALARALVNPARALLLDDPFFRLSSQLIVQVSEYIREVAQTRGVPVVIASQDVENLLAVSDQVGVFSDGAIAQLGRPLDVIRRPKTAFVASFLSNANILEGSITRAEAGMLLVNTPLGELLGVAASSAEFAEGEGVRVAMRPEAIHIDLMAPEENAFPLQIEKTSFRGALAHIKCISGATPLSVIEINPKSIDSSSSREQFGWVDADDVVIIKR